MDRLFGAEAGELSGHNYSYTGGGGAGLRALYPKGSEKSINLPPPLGVFIKIIKS